MANLAPAGGVDMVLERAKPAIVRIEVVTEEGRSGRMVKQRGFGSGAIISPEGHVLTNHHVAGRGTRFRCTLADREEIPATLVGTDALSDLAVIQLDLGARRDPAAPLTVAEFGDSSQLNVGDTVYALGSPAALSQSVTKGIVANTAMITPKIIPGGMFALDGEQVGSLVRWIGHDAVIFGGNSGGPLVNDEGRIVGINEVGIGSLGGAIPGNLAKAVAAELIAKGEVTRGWIGIEVQELLRNEPAQRGVRVASVFANSPAEQAGIKPGYFLHMLNGEPIADCRSPEDLPVFNALILDSTPGSRLEFEGERAGQPVRFSVEVVTRAATRGFEREFTGWGMTARAVTPMGAIELKRADTGGVQVQSVRTGGPAAAAKPALADNDIVTHLDGGEIRSMDDFLEFQRSLADDAGERPVLVAFERGVTHDKYLTVVKVGPEPKGQTPPAAERGWLGAEAQELGPELAEALDLKGVAGVRLTRVVADGPAAQAELRAGDLLTMMDGQAIPVRRPEDLRAFFAGIAARDPGTELVFEFLRDGASRSATVRLAASPGNEDGAAKFKDPDFEFAAIDLTDARRDSDNLPSTLQAARVTDVTANGWASLAGLQKNDLILAVDGGEIAGAEALEERLAALKQARRPHTVFFVQRGVRHLFLLLEPAWPDLP